MKPFELKSIPSERGQARIFLIQNPLKTDSVDRTDVPTTLAAIQGTAITDAMDLLAEIIGAESIDSFLKTPGVRELDEKVAISLGLLFVTTASLRSAERIRGIAEHISRMEDWEVGYWLKKITSSRSENAKANAIESFRTLALGK